MSTSSIYKKAILRLLTIFVVVGITVAPLTPAFTVKKAHAFDAVTVVGGTGTIQETIAAAGATISAAANKITSWATFTLNTKELVLDGIAWALVNEILHQMSQSLITWINSGFEGSPAFVRDLKGFLLGVADRVAGDFIWGSDLNFLCSPFQLDIRLALDLQYRAGRNFGAGQQCTLSGVVSNMENFMEGDFFSGGWDGWFTMTQNPHNNPYGALVLAQEEFSARLVNSRGQEIKLLDFGKGFQSLKDEYGHILTPGTAIEAQLNNTLDSGQRRLHVADEINEIMAALFTQLVRQAFSGVGGLLGLTEAGYSGSTGTYYHDLALSTGANALGYQNADTNPIESAITIEIEYGNLNHEIVSLIDDAATYPQERYGESCETPLKKSLVTARTDALAAITKSNGILILLNDIAIRYDAASNTPNGTEIQADIMQEFLSLKMSGQIHTEIDTMSLDVIEIPEVERTIDTWMDTVDRNCRFMQP